MELTCKLNMSTEVDPLKLSDGDDRISPMNELAFENVCSELSLSDLVSLSKTSIKMLQKVQSFSLHYILSGSRMEKMKKFMNCGLLSPPEEEIKQQVVQLGNPSLQNSLHLLKYIKSYGHFIRRYSICDAEHFHETEYGNIYSIDTIKERYHYFNRDTVMLKPYPNPTERIGFKHVLRSIPPGKYVISIHFQPIISMYYYQPATYIAVFDKRADDNGPAIVEVEMKKGLWWRREQYDALEFNNSLLNGNAVVMREQRYGNIYEWFTMKLKLFKISKDTDITFVWKEIDKSFGKIRFDFIQIEQV